MAACLLIVVGNKLVVLNLDSCWLVFLSVNSNILSFQGLLVDVPCSWELAVLIPDNGPPQPTCFDEPHCLFRSVRPGFGLLNSHFALEWLCWLSIFENFRAYSRLQALFLRRHITDLRLWLSRQIGHSIELRLADVAPAVASLVSAWVHERLVESVELSVELVGLWYTSLWFEIHKIILWLPIHIFFKFVPRPSEILLWVEFLHLLEPVGLSFLVGGLVGSAY